MSLTVNEQTYHIRPDTGAIEPVGGKKAKSIDAINRRLDREHTDLIEETGYTYISDIEERILSKYDIRVYGAVRVRRKTGKTVVVFKGQKGRFIESAFKQYLRVAHRYIDDAKGIAEKEKQHMKSHIGPQLIKETNRQKDTIKEKK